MSEVKYAIEKYRLKKSLMKGFEIAEDKNKKTFLKAVDSLEGNGIFIMPLDSGMDGAEWGRLKFLAEMGEQNAYIVTVAASDRLFDYSSVEFSDCKLFVNGLKNRKTYTNISDLVLYSLNGRYLYILIEAFAEEHITINFRNMVVDRIGDVLMGTFPRIYQERNSFFHRYISVLSSEFSDMEDEINSLPELLNLDTCPKELLPVYGRWLGIDTGESFLPEDILRAFVKEAYELNKMKGTRYCLERICQILLGESGIIVERNQLTEYFDKEQMKEYDRIYGKSRYDVTLLLKKNLPQARRSQLEYILDQFLPLRCNLHIVELDQIGGLDSHTYLDVNAAVFAATDASLDDTGTLDQNLILS